MYFASKFDIVNKEIIIWQVMAPNWKSPNGFLWFKDETIAQNYKKFLIFLYSTIISISQFILIS